MKLLESVVDSLDLLHRLKREIIGFIPLFVGACVWFTYVSESGVCRVGFKYARERGIKQDFGKIETDPGASRLNFGKVVRGISIQLQLAGCNERYSFFGHTLVKSNGVMCKFSSVCFRQTLARLATAIQRPESSHKSRPAA
jgi:hypothetical protein